MGSKKWFIAVLATFAACVLVSLLINHSPTDPRPHPQPQAQGGLHSAANCGHEPGEIEEDRPLTVEETIGLALTGEGPNSHLEKRADPRAKEALYEIINNPDEGLYWFQSNCYLILGHIGDSNDAERMRDVVTSYSGQLSHAQRNRVTAIVGALGIMSRRSINVAGDILDEMSCFEFWNQWFTKAVRREDFNEYQLLSRVMSAQARARRRDPDEFRDDILRHLTNEQQRQNMVDYFDHLRKLRQDNSPSEYESCIPTDRDFAMLRRLYENREERIASESEAWKERKRKDKTIQ